MNSLTKHRKLPDWLKAKAPSGETYLQVKRLMRESSLHTVCEEAHCPNIGECWETKSATFMILGDTCTRHCRYCAVKTGRPSNIDLEEPMRLAKTVKHLGLEYCVITSVNRDDLSDGGALIFAMCIKYIKELIPSCKVEVLIPDFEGSMLALDTVIKAQPNVLNHNIESTRQLFHKVRPKGDYDRSLHLLARSKELDPSLPSKSGIIVGMGETLEDITATMRDLRNVNCDLLTVGQYLRPSTAHLPVAKFYPPQEFQEIERIGNSLGFAHVAAGPMVRSSYHADQQHDAAIKRLQSVDTLEPNTYN